MSASGVGQATLNLVGRLPAEQDRLRRNLDDDTTRANDVRERVGVAFPHAGELRERRAELISLQAELMDLDTNEPAPAAPTAATAPAHPHRYDDRHHEAFADRSADR